MPNGWAMPLQARVMVSLLKTPWLMAQQAKQLNVPPSLRAEFAEHLRVMSREAYIRIYEELVDFRLPAAVREVTTPVLATAGGRETPIILEAVTEIAAMMPNAEGRLAPGLRHGWSIENPRLFSDMLRAWFTGLPLPAELRSPHAAGRV